MNHNKTRDVINVENESNKNFHTIDSKSSPRLSIKKYKDRNSKSIYSNNNVYSKMTTKNGVSFIDKIKNQSKKSHLHNEEDYSRFINDIMSNYKNDQYNKNRDDEYLMNMSLEEENEIKLNLKQNQINNSYGYLGTSENSIMKVEVKDFDYKNPFESLKTLKKNKVIYDNINVSFLNRQKMFYDRALVGINRHLKLKATLPKVKVSNLMPKGIDLSQIVNTANMMSPSSPNNIKQYNNQDSSGKKSAKKNKNKKNEVIIQASQIISSSNNLQLYANYVYANKNFPEGREQFTLNYNLVDLVLYGGIASNKNNNIWSLDPSK